GGRGRGGRGGWGEGGGGGGKGLSSCRADSPEERASSETLASPRRRRISAATASTRSSRRPDARRRSRNSSAISVRSASVSATMSRSSSLFPSLPHTSEKARIRSVSSSRHAPRNGYAPPGRKRTPSVAPGPAGGT